MFVSRTFVVLALVLGSLGGLAAQSTLTVPTTTAWDTVPSTITTVAVMTTEITTIPTDDNTAVTLPSPLTTAQTESTTMAPTSETTASPTPVPTTPAPATTTTTEPPPKYPVPHEKHDGVPYIQHDILPHNMSLAQHMAIEKTLNYLADITSFQIHHGGYQGSHWRISSLKWAVHYEGFHLIHVSMAHRENTNCRYIKRFKAVELAERNCIDEFYGGHYRMAIIQQVFHAFGFSSEMSRPDRAKFFIVNQNILESSGLSAEDLQEWKIRKTPRLNELVDPDIYHFDSPLQWPIPKGAIELTELGQRLLTEQGFTSIDQVGRPKRISPRELTRLAKAYEVGQTTCQLRGRNYQNGELVEGADLIACKTGEVQVGAKRLECMRRGWLGRIPYCVPAQSIIAYENFEKTTSEKSTKVESNGWITQEANLTNLPYLHADASSMPSGRALWCDVERDRAYNLGNSVILRLPANANGNSGLCLAFSYFRHYAFKYLPENITVDETHLSVALELSSGGVSMPHPVWTTEDGRNGLTKGFVEFREANQWHHARLAFDRETIEDLLPEGAEEVEITFRFFAHAHRNASWKATSINQKQYEEAPRRIKYAMVLDEVVVQQSEEGKESLCDWLA